MRGLTLLCLVGFILTASWPKGGTVPLPDTGTDRSQTNGSLTKAKAVKVVQHHPYVIGTSARIPRTDGEVIEVNQK
ncbi:hypothetical protein VZT92_014128 [Zoarces viviparus]|uniref:Uncharacterized protein n=1 Tax=Zoarces viviparus TaxID=48416 RepID=A0AAW1EY07_ZOAVI